MSAVTQTPAALWTALAMARNVVQGNGAEATRCLRESKCAPRQLAAVLRAEGLVGFAFSPDGQTVLPETWDDDIVGSLRSHYEEQSQFLDEMRTVLCETGEALEAARIEFIVLKGRLFGERYYDTPYRRRSRDLDILVREQAFEHCLQHLEALGFATSDSRRRALSARKRRIDHAASLERGHHQIDLHWRLRNAPSYQLDYEAVWREATIFRSRDRSFRVLATESELVFHLVSIAHDLERGACRVKHLIDAYCLVDRYAREIGEPSFSVRCQRERTAGSCWNVLDLLVRLLGCGDRWPRVTQLLARESSRIVCRSDEEAMRLLAGPRGNVHNQRWFTRIYPVWSWREVHRAIDRNVLRPGRIPWMIIKGVRRLTSS